MVVEIGNNVNNHIKSLEKLSSLGWKVIVIWECELKKNNREDTFSKLLGLFKQENIY
jgi:DNA mismatch endonuclease (patch repair protein)